MATRDAAAAGRLVSVARPQAAGFHMHVDGTALPAFPGQSVLAAILSTRATLRHAQAAGEERAGFCLMGACQECWVWREDGRRLRACTTPAEPGMRLVTAAPPGWPPAGGTP